MHDFPNPDDPVQWGSEAVAELLGTINRRSDMNAEMPDYGSVVFSFEHDRTEYRFEVALNSGNMWLHAPGHNGTDPLWTNKGSY